MQFQVSLNLSIHQFRFNRSIPLGKPYVWFGDRFYFLHLGSCGPIVLTFRKFVGRFDDVVEGDDVLEDEVGNLPPLPGIYPDYAAPILRRGPSGLRLTMARWGMPTPPQFLVGKRTDPGVTNIRNLASPHWRRWLGVGHRCLVPFTSFSEFDTRPGSPRNHPIWFALGQDRPLACFAGIWTEWTSVRKLKEGEVTATL